jgi:hypothetical protein
MFDTTQRHLSGQMAEMTQFRQEVSATEKANVTALGDLSTALEKALAQEREKAEFERNKLTTEVVALINAALDGQYTRWSDTIGHAKQELSASQNRVQGGYQLVSRGWDSWAEREGIFSKKLLGNKDEIKKSIVEAAKVLQFLYYSYNRLLINVVLQFRRVQDGFMHRQLNWLILR